jgi:hypothetical protein
MPADRPVSRFLASLGQTIVAGTRMLVAAAGTASGLGALAKGIGMLGGGHSGPWAVGGLFGAGVSGAFLVLAYDAFTPHLRDLRDSTRALRGLLPRPAEADQTIMPSARM